MSCVYHVWYSFITAEIALVYRANTRTSYLTDKRYFSLHHVQLELIFPPGNKLMKTPKGIAKRRFVGVMVTRLPPKEKIAGSSPVRNVFFQTPTKIAAEAAFCQSSFSLAFSIIKPPGKEFIPCTLFTYTGTLLFTHFYQLAGMWSLCIRGQHKQTS